MKTRCAAFILAVVAGFFLAVTDLPAQAEAEPAPGPESEPGQPGFSIDVDFGGGEGGPDIGVAIQIVVLMTLLSLAPAIVLLMTSFMRIIIVLGFLRNALGMQSTPPNQMLIGIAIFLTFFVMMPVGERIQSEALAPYREGEITSADAMDRAVVPLRDFMLGQTRASDIDFFLGLTDLGQMEPDELPMRVVAPAFVLSELRTAFQMGFLIFLPFLIVDFVVATVLMGMGMMMMPPVIVSLPFKILLFVLVDGWYLVVRSLVQSF